MTTIILRSGEVIPLPIWYTKTRAIALIKDRHQLSMSKYYGSYLVRDFPHLAGQFKQGLVILRIAPHEVLMITES